MLPSNQAMKVVYLEKYRTHTQAHDLLVILIKLTAICKKYEICGANAAYLLNHMGINF